MSNPLKIALIGRLGSGKSFVANRLCDAWDGHKTSFAAEVYRVCEEILGRPLDKSNPAERQMLTDIGTEWGREGRALDDATMAKLAKIWPHKSGYPNIWIDAFDRAQKAREDDQPTVLDDLRFGNELTYLLDAGFIPLLVTCSDETRAKRLNLRGDGYAASLDPHASEMFSNLLTEKAILEPILPVLWNDDAPKPELPYLFDLDQIVEISQDQNAYKSLLKFQGRGWDALLTIS